MGNTAWFKTAINRAAVQPGAPPPPNDGLNDQKSAFFSGNLTHSANSIGGRRGVAQCKKCWTFALFWPSANCLAWRKGPENHRILGSEGRGNIGHQKLRKRSAGRPVSRVLFRANSAAAVISLAGRLPGRSSGLPRSRHGPDQPCSLIWPCSRWGLPSQPVARLLVGSYPAFSPLPSRVMNDEG